tara:strand:+ start:731 stop:1510 length:780 start_codon:yes stop_codon:yes gene_type:complete
MESTIKLLDGQSWDSKELLEKMLDDSFYYGYLGKAALSSSSLKQLLKSPKYYARQLETKQEETKALREGKLIHLLLLEAHREEELVVIDVKSRAAKTYKDAVLEHGAENVFTGIEVAQAKNVANAVKQCPEAWAMIDGATTEVPGAGTIMGLPFRAKADILHEGKRIVDLKTTADIYKFKRSAYDFGYDAQAAIYTHIFGLQEFTFLVVDKTTLDVGIYTTTPAFIKSGQAKVKEAIEVYEKFFIKGEALSSHIIRGVL